jgi:hypothetical protein
MGPSEGISWRRVRLRIWEIERMWGERPPWRQRVEFSIRQESGRQSRDGRERGRSTENLHEIVPGVRVSVFFQYFIVKAVLGGDGSRFVVSSQEDYLIRIQNFIAKQQQNCLYTMITSVDKIPNKYIFGPRQFAAHSKQLQQIIKLSMDIPADCDWCGDWLYIRFLNQNQI